MPDIKKLSGVVGVSDMTAAKEFYVAALSLEVTSESAFWIDLSCGNGSLALSPNNGDRPEGRAGVERTKIIFEVTGLDELVPHIERLGGKVVHILDPFQNVFQLAERHAG